MNTHVHLRNSAADTVVDSRFSYDATSPLLQHHWTSLGSGPILSEHEPRLTQVRPLGRLRTVFTLACHQLCSSIHSPGNLDSLVTSRASAIAQPGEPAAFRGTSASKGFRHVCSVRVHQKLAWSISHCLRPVASGLNTLNGWHAEVRQRSSTTTARAVLVVSAGTTM